MYAVVADVMDLVVDFVVVASATNVTTGSASAHTDLDVFSAI